MTDAEKLALVAAATTIDERMAWGFQPVGGDDEVCAERWSVWASEATRGDETLLRDRLRADGVEPERARVLLGAVRDPEGRIPDWLPWFERFLNDVITGKEVPAGLHKPAAESKAAGTSGAEPRPRMPFELFFEPAARRALTALQAELGSAGSRVDAAAYDSLYRSLLERLAAPCGPPFYELFDAWREHFEFAADAGNADGYHGFVSRLRLGDAEPFFFERPVLARIVGTRLRQWHESSREMISRLEHDRAEIRETLLEGVDPGRVRDIEPGLSDPHDDGRQVAIIEFGDGRKVVYKPRDMGIDTAWSDVVGWLEERRGAADVRVPRVVTGTGYGWAEFIATESCADAAEVALYFRRCGGLLALFHGLRSTDIHAENLLPAGAMPVWIDVETAMHLAPPRPDTGVGSAAARRAILDFVEHSVLRTCMLPMRMSIPGGGTLSVGALSAQQDDVVTSWGWEHAETDAMRFFRKPSVKTGNAALPQLHDASVDAHGFVHDVVEGFRSMAADLHRLAPELSAAGGPLERLAACSTRVVPRPTNHYFILRWRMDLPRNLKDGASWSIPTYHGWHDADGVGVMRQCRAERAALTGLDIPRFAGRASETDIRCGDLVVEQWAARPALEESRETLRGFDEDAVAAEVAVMREHFGIEPGTAAVERIVAASVGAADFRAVARNIGTHLAEVAQRADIDGDASMAWMISSPVGVELSDWELSASDDDLYTGAPGIAVLFAALSRIDADGEWAERAYQSLASLRARIARDPVALIARFGIGGLGGTGSMARALELCGRSLEDNDLLEEAFALLRATRREHIEADNQFDVSAGSAGFLLSCLSLHRRLPRNTLLQRARSAAEHLVASQVAVDSGGAGWPVYTIDRHRRALTGVAHGSAGVALALLRLHALGGEPEFLDSARAAIAAERGVFVPGKGWPDLRRADVGFGCAWCYGAAGIGLARLLHADIWADEEVAGEIDAALEITRRHAYDNRDHLCCGEMSRVELLLVVGRRRDDPALVAEAADRAVAMLQQARRRGFLFPLGPMHRNPSLFTGVAGVAYELLRLADPEGTPSIVAWE